ncbi:methionyl-tRNA formyltransferase [Oceanibacterium hippocampi]|uniref:Methionyl-tRNA formyltransferase n=1 Tax=Oceanibacterium hippocampi TaxID=745714 RepID=A0A1Y5RTQ1_9PROT|nr:methionyl-tRNA formyltransferase [Oceanibacterium hippocampi]SLN25274.1 Methionyl-tRNA formyltransferase [Oceanibacterium hippocampi]
MPAPLKLAFLGTPDFSIPVLDALVAAGHEIAVVYTQPPRPAGRGKKDRISPVHERAMALGIEVRTPKSLRDPDAQAAFSALDLDAAVVVAYGLILPKAILDAPRLGCINVHASLLPRWRGAAPIQRAVMAGDAETGIAIMQMAEGLDTGPVLMEARCRIGSGTTAGELHDQLSRMGAELIVPALEGRAAGTLRAVSQDEAGASYAKKIEKAEARIDWDLPAVEIERRIRGLNPSPGAFFETGAERIKVHRAELVEGTGRPGEVLDEQPTIACGEGALRLIEVQRQGKAPMAAADFWRGFRLRPGERLG